MHKKIFAILAVLTLAVVPVVYSVYYDGYFTNLLVKGFVDMPEQSSAPGNPGTDTGRLYVYDSAGGTVLNFKNSSGTITEVAGQSKFVQLPVTMFGMYDAAGNIGYPLFDYDDSMPNLVWADGETTKAVVTFRVPDDFASGGAFKVFATESDSTTANQVDFEVFVNADGSAIDASATNQTPVALAGTTSTPDEVTLTVATDFGSLAAGQLVTLRIWRDDVADGTGDLEVKGVAFYYN